MKSEHAIEITLLFCAAEVLQLVLAVLSSSSSIVFGISLVVSIKRRNSLYFFLTPQSKPLYELKSSLLTKSSFSGQSRNQITCGATPGPIANDCSPILSLPFCVIFSRLAPSTPPAAAQVPCYLFCLLPCPLCCSSHVQTHDRSQSCTLSCLYCQRCFC